MAENTLSFPFRFGVVTDEIDVDLARACQVARELSMAHVELNQLSLQPGSPARNIVELNAEEVREAQRLLGHHGLQAAVLGTPCFKALQLDGAAKHNVRGHAPLGEHLDMLKRALEYAQILGCPMVRIFSFRKRGMEGLGNPSPRLPQGGDIPDDDLQKIVEGLRLAGDLAMRTAVTLVVENVRSCWGNSGENVARMVDAVNHPRVRILWDPGNAHVSGGVAFPDGYYAVRGRMVHVHVKDAAVRDVAGGLTSWEAVGGGEIDYVSHLRALRADNYTGLITLETHWRGNGLSPEESTRESFRGLLRACAA